MKNESKKQSKMSLAARKAWETRRRRYGGKGKKSRKVVDEEGGITIEQLTRAYRKGQLVLKGKQGYRKGQAVKMDAKLREYLEFLKGRKYFEEVIIQKLWAEANRLAKKMIWQEKSDQ